MGRKRKRGSAEELRAFRAQPASLEAMEALEGIEYWLCSDHAHSLSLQQLEADQQQRGRELMRLLLQAHVDSRGDGDVGEAIQVSEPGSRSSVLYTHRRVHPRFIHTIFGVIDIERMGYGLRGELSIHPLDEELQLPGRIYSYTIQKWLVKHSIQSPFDLAVEAVKDHTGVSVPKRTAEEILLDASVDFDDFYETRKGCSDDLSPILVGSIDCKGIPMVKAELAEKSVRRKKGEKAQKKRMATVAAVYDQYPRVRDPEEIIQSLFHPDKDSNSSHDKRFRPHNKRVWASLQAGKDAFIQDVHQEMIRRDPRHARRHVVVTDGERALQKRVIKTMSNVTLILDLIHVLEYLWSAAHALHPEGSAKAKHFVSDRLRRILHGNVSQVVKGLRQMVTKRQLKGPKANALSKAADYFYNNRSRMRYHDYLALGFPIASGPVESA
jgi:hypothetical protein